MGTISFVGLYYEFDCWRCEGKGYFEYPNTIGSSIIMTRKECKHCKGKIKLWRRLHYTHARTYEEALKKLMPRLSQWSSLDMSTRWFLAWKDRDGKFFSVTDVSKGVRYRWNKIVEKRMKKLKKREQKAK